MMWPERPYALITGASEGIGAVFAEELAKRGTHSLILVARTTSKLEKVEEKIRKSAGKNIDVVLVQEDLATTDGPQKVYTSTKHLPVALLVNNAGMAIGGLSEELAFEKIQQILSLNIVALTKLTFLYMPQLREAAEHYHQSKERPSSSRTMAGIVNMSSMSAFMPIPRMALYAASKAYVLSLTESLHHEQRMQNSTLVIVCICPGVTISEIWSKEGANAGKVLLPFTTIPHVVHSSLQAFDRNSAVVIPGIFNQIVVLSLRLAPRWLVRRVSTILMGQDGMG